ncbi:NUDIX domain-containing protein [Marinospirillum sp.]|uniref:NUDIX domain-containing protein n=1 Tax=Marinospirillum sp. TaxID=2183934 RepID=UPI003A8400FB
MTQDPPSAQVFQHQDVRYIEDQVLYQGFTQLAAVQLQHRRFAGGWTPTLRREVLLRQPAVGVLAYDPWQDQVVLVEQLRIGAREDHHSPWLLELIAGLVEPGEEAEAVAHREAWEEAQLTLLSLEKITRYYSSPGASNEQVDLFCALVDASQAASLAGLADEQEDIRVVCLPRDQALAQALTGRANNAMSLIAFHWLALHAPRLQQQASCLQRL